jgi:hydroxymethylglutaryl-CoA reductase
MMYAHEFAAADPYRAATHNKGIMNGIDAMAVATGNDWRSIAAGAHAYACRDGAYRSLSNWKIQEGHLIGMLELPMAVSTVGPLVCSRPRVRLALRLLGVSGARELAEVMVAVGLASNLSAMRALVTEGIQKGHMALHARAVSYAAGARGTEVEKLRKQLLAGGEVKLARARELLRVLNRRTARAPRPRAARAGRFRRSPAVVAGEESSGPAPCRWSRGRHRRQVARKYRNTAP